MDKRLKHIQLRGILQLQHISDADRIADITLRYTMREDTFLRYLLARSGGKWYLFQVTRERELLIEKDKFKTRREAWKRLVEIIECFNY